MPSYRAIRRCYHNAILYKVGDEIHVGKDEKVPRHFVPSGAFSQEAVKAAAVEDSVGRTVKVKPQKA